MPDHRGLSPVAAYAFATVRSIVSAFVPKYNSEWQKYHTPILLMVFPSSSVLTAPQASDASPNADKPALNHIVNKRHCQNCRKRKVEVTEKRIGSFGEGDAGSGRSLAGCVVGW